MIEGSNVFTVEKLERHEKCLLKRVGYIELKSDFRFEVKNEKSEESIQILNELLEII